VNMMLFEHDRQLINTRTCNFFLRGKLILDEIIKEKGIENYFISEITVVELSYDAKNSDKAAKSYKAVDLFVSGISIIPI